VKVLVIGEKTSQVKSFASTLCGSFSSSKQAKYIYTYTGSWRNPNGNLIIFTFLPLAGHITDLKTKSGYDWGECPPIKLVEDSKALTFVTRRPYSKIIKSNLKGKDELWLATDPDSEGQNIAYEALKIVKSEVKKGNIPIRRVWNSSLTKKEIIRAFTAPRVWEEELALAVQGRRLADAWLGFAGTRELTFVARQVARVKVLSVGRVQLPTLRLIVHRDFAIESFDSKDQWKLLADLRAASGTFTATHKKGIFEKEEEVKKILEIVKSAGTAKIGSISRKKQSRLPPIPMNTTAAVSLLSRLLKVTAKKALDIMVDLYNKGLLSYPRTENAMFTDGFPHKEILNKIGMMEPFSIFKQEIKNMKQVRNNGKKKETEDHDPIHPTGSLEGLTKLPVKNFRAWDILTRYYFSLFMSNLQSEITKVSIEIASEPFEAKGNVILDKGWQKAHDWYKPKEEFLPQLEDKEDLEVRKTYIKKSKTKPPPRWSESKILLEMEKLRIGTKSSRPDIIQKLLTRKYVVKSGQKIVSTTWGRATIASLEPIWPEIVTPQYTRHVEEQMDLVSSKKRGYKETFDDLKKEYIGYHRKLQEMLPRYKALLLSLNLNSQADANSKVSPEVNRILMKLISPEEYQVTEEED